MEDGSPTVADSVLQSLQDQLKEKQASIVELRAQAEQRVLQELEQKQQWQHERTNLQRRVDELQSLLEGERERWKGMEREKERLECRVAELMEKSSHSVSSPSDPLCVIRCLIWCPMSNNTYVLNCCFICVSRSEWVTGC